jgi:imidazolonepropionase-like amidohydrolase
MTATIRCGALIDGKAAAPRANATLAIAGDRILGVSDRIAGAAVDHDWSDLTVLPGLIDSHDHLLLDPGDEVAQFNASDESTLARGRYNAHHMLRAGITTLRDCGGWHHLDLAMRREIDSGATPGPRTLVSGVPLTIPDGHLSIWGGGVKTFDAMRRAVRSQATAGADFIKIFVTGGLYADDAERLKPAFSPDALRVVIDEAHSLGRRVIAHCHGGPGTLAAVEAGVDSIEHGVYCRREDFDAMGERRVPLVVTFNVFDRLAEDQALAPDLRAKFRNAVETYRGTLSVAREAGVIVGIGSDTVHADLVSEMRALRAAGFSGMEAVQAATANGAVCCGLPDVGTIEAGRRADLVAVRGDPSRDPAVLNDIVHVVRGGNLIF